MLTFFRKKFKRTRSKGISKNPFFYFGIMSVVLFGLLFFSSDSLAQPNYQKSTQNAFFGAFFKNTDNLGSNDLFVGQNKALALETPDLKIIQDNSIGAVSTPSTLTTQTLGDVFGGPDQQRKDVINYTVQAGDTVTSLASEFQVTPQTIAWANNISVNSNLKVGSSLVILPFSGISYIAKNGDTLSQIAKIYKPKSEDTSTFIDNVIADNSLANEGDIFIGDPLLLRDAVMPTRSTPAFVQVALPNSSLIYPLLNFRITQGLHYFNAIDIQPLAGCGTPIYASAAGVVQRAVSDGGYHLGLGNHVSILHAALGSIVTYYGHMMKVFVSPGEQVYQGQEIGLVGGQPGMAGAGDSTGCHTHWEVINARNPLAGIPVGTIINVNKQ